MTEDVFEVRVKRSEERVGTLLADKWRLDRVLGVGGMASVYEATHRNRKRAAIKLLHLDLAMNPAVRERFLREGYLANSVGHPGAVVIHDDGATDDGSAFLVMELLDGETLEERWQGYDQRLPLDEVLFIADQVLSTLAAAHAKGIVHRDLKPENLFLTRPGAVKLLDFGIARVRELGLSSSKTQTGSTLGTPSFMSPEQARGRWEDVDAQSDVWAVGATMFTLLTGHHVHEGGTVNEVLAFAVTLPARSIATLMPHLPELVVETIDRALAYDKRQRWPSALAMQTAVRRARDALPATGVTFVPTLRAGGRTAEGTLVSSSLRGGGAPARSEALTTARGVTRGPLGRVFGGWRAAALGGIGLIGLGLLWSRFRKADTTHGTDANAVVSSMRSLASTAEIRAEDSPELRAKPDIVPVGARSAEPAVVPSSKPAVATTRSERTKARRSTPTAPPPLRSTAAKPADPFASRQ